VTKIRGQTKIIAILDDYAWPPFKRDKPVNKPVNETGAMAENYPQTDGNKLGGV
jgi:hypothetical protein